MPQASGSFVGKASAQTMLAVPDAAGHELGVVEVSGPQVSADPLWNGATVFYWGMADLVAGNGPQTGYFMNRHVNGDIDRGTFSGTISTAGDGVTMEGTWTYSGGTGTFAKITGSGTYRGRILPTEVQTSWEGTYQLG